MVDAVCCRYIPKEVGASVTRNILLKRILAGTEGLGEFINNGRFRYTHGKGCLEQAVETFLQCLGAILYHVLICCIYNRCQQHLSFFPEDHHIAIIGTSAENLSMNIGDDEVEELLSHRLDIPFHLRYSGDD